MTEKEAKLRDEAADKPFRRSYECSDAFKQGWNACHQAAAERERMLIATIKEVREGNALMAEGEGDDPQVYMDMARHCMKRCDEALKALDGSI